MGKVVKPLRMNNDVMARTMEEVRDNFDVKKILGYYLDGKLKKWLEARCYEEEYEKVNELAEDDPNVARKLCDIFGVDYVEEYGIDVETIREAGERLCKLKKFTEDEEILSNVECVAFDQEELVGLYEKGIEKIYLCAGEFQIPEEKIGLDYIEVGNASVEYAITTSNLSLPESLADLIVCRYTELEDFILWRVYDDDKKSELYQAFFRDKNKKDDMMGDYYVWNFKKDEYFSFDIPSCLSLGEFVPYGNKVIYSQLGYSSGDDDGYSIKVFDVEAKEVETVWKQYNYIDSLSLSNVCDNQIYFQDCNSKRILLNLISKSHKLLDRPCDFLFNNVGVYSCNRKVIFVDISTGNTECIEISWINSYERWIYDDEYFIHADNSILGIKQDKTITKYCDIVSKSYMQSVGKGYSLRYYVFYEERYSFLKKLYVFDKKSKTLQYFEPKESFYIDDMQVYLVNRFLYFKNKFTQYRIDLSKEIEIVKVGSQN